MARTRSRRRRQNLLVLVAALVTVVVVVLVRDVGRIAASSDANRVVLDRNFGVLASGIIDDENQLGVQTAKVLAHGAAQGRVALASQLEQLSLSAQQLNQRAAVLSEPDVDNGAQVALIEVTRVRTGTVRAVIGELRRRLDLPGAPRSAPNVAAWQTKSRHADHTWATWRRRLHLAPGRVRLPRSVFALTGAPLTNELTQLTSSPHLALHRSVTLAAIGVTPAPFPSSARRMVLPPTHHLHVAISVRNRAYADQSVRVTVSVTPTGQATVTESRVIHLGPLGATAVALPEFDVHPSETGTVTILLNGAPVVPTSGARRTFVLTVAASTGG